MKIRLQQVIGLILLGFASGASSRDLVMVEAESFGDKGGWVVDQQFMDIMGSPYLLAHGLGVSVTDARATVTFAQSGSYVLWVRTKDWAPHPTGPGRFRIGVDGQILEPVLGSDGVSEWHWVRAGRVRLEAGPVALSLHDLTGFDGRCDVLLFAADEEFSPPNDIAGLEALRRKIYNRPGAPADAATFDFVVVGGGMAGTCAAVQAARLGLRVALIHDRPVLGGNNSSEVRVHLMGDWQSNHYPRLGRIVRELDNGDPGNAAVISDGRDLYGDRRKLGVVRAEKNISLYLNWHAHEVEMRGDAIAAIRARHIENGDELRFPAPLFADCTGDGSIGFLAGADYRMGREGEAETGETMAPEHGDAFTMGMSNLWNAVQTGEAIDFPDCPWALPFSEETHWDVTRADWRWETGFGNFDMIQDAERIRDHNLRAIFGNWAFLKRQKVEKYARWKLNWVAYIGGKRESRRLLGDVILTQQDIQNQILYPDGFVTATWDLDLHFPDSSNSRYYPGEEFISWYQHPSIKPYPIPFRCLYSRNIDNLMMAGRNISVTHVALGSVRVMRTTGMMGETIGYAAHLCRKHGCTPRGLYQRHLQEFIELLNR